MRPKGLKKAADNLALISLRLNFKIMKRVTDRAV